MKAVKKKSLVVKQFGRVFKTVKKKTLVLKQSDRVLEAIKQKSVKRKKKSLGECLRLTRRKQSRRTRKERIKHGQEYNQTMGECQR